MLIKTKMLRCDGAHDEPVLWPVPDTADDGWRPESWSVLSYSASGRLDLCAACTKRVRAMLQTQSEVEDFSIVETIARAVEHGGDSRTRSIAAYIRSRVWKEQG